MALRPPSTSLPNNRQVLVIVPVLTFVIGLMFRERFKSLSRRFFAFIYGAYFARRNEQLLRKYKLELFSTLKDVKSTDPVRRDENTIRILEIGVGTGTNLEFYPPRSTLVCVEPNPYFQKYFAENRDQFPDLMVESVCANAEDMKQIPTESVDIVVSTLVICSVNDPPAVVREIKRVLTQDIVVYAVAYQGRCGWCCPTSWKERASSLVLSAPDGTSTKAGGRYYYLEHESYRPGNWYRTAQRILDPFWRIINDGCSLTRDVGNQIQFMGFREVYEQSLQPMELPWPVRPLVYGTAVK